MQPGPGQTERAPCSHEGPRRVEPETRATQAGARTAGDSGGVHTILGPGKRLVPCRMYQDRPGQGLDPQQGPYASPGAEPRLPESREAPGTPGKGPSGRRDGWRSPAGSPGHTLESRTGPEVQQHQLGPPPPAPRPPQAAAVSRGKPGLLEARGGRRPWASGRPRAGPHPENPRNQRALQDGKWQNSGLSREQNFKIYIHSTVVFQLISPELHFIQPELVCIKGKTPGPRRGHHRSALLRGLGARGRHSGLRVGVPRGSWWRWGLGVRPTSFRPGDDGLWVSLGLALEINGLTLDHSSVLRGHGELRESCRGEMGHAVRRQLPSGGGDGGGLPWAGLP